jgi:putative MFS transporter
MDALSDLSERREAAAIIARLERIPVSRWHVRARMFVGMATFFDAFDLLAIASAVPVLAGAWHLSGGQIGAIFSAAFVGQVIGALCFGWIAERFGRLAALRWTVLIFSVASLTCAFCWDANSLMAARFVQGFGLGGEVPVAGAYISELAKATRRGRFFLLYEMIFGVGIAVTGLLSIWVVPHLGWQAMFVIGAAPALLGLVLRRLLPESPRWLISRGRLREADSVVRDIEAKTQAYGIVLAEPGEIDDAALRPREKTRLFELFEGRYCRRTLMIWSAWFCTYFIVYASTNWLPTLYRTVYHLDLQTALALSTANSIAGISGDVLVAFLIDVLGRRLWYCLAFFLSALPLLALWWIGPTDPYVVALLYGTSYIFIGSNAVSLVLYTGELYPTRLRAAGGSIASVWARIAASVSPVIVGLTVTDGGIGTVFLIFAASALLGTVICGIWGVETKRRILEEVSP